MARLASLILWVILRGWLAREEIERLIVEGAGLDWKKRKWMMVRWYKEESHVLVGRELDYVSKVGAFINLISVFRTDFSTESSSMLVFLFIVACLK
jgi:hypothetical protein